MVTYVPNFYGSSDIRLPVGHVKHSSDTQISNNKMTNGHLRSKFYGSSDIRMSVGHVKHSSDTQISNNKMT